MISAQGNPARPNYVRVNVMRAVRLQKAHSDPSSPPSLRLNLPGVTYLLSAAVGHHVPVVDLLPSGIVRWRRGCIGIVTIAIRRIVVSVGPAPIGVTPAPAGKPKADYEMGVAIVMMVPVVAVPVLSI